MCGTGTRPLVFVWPRHVRQSGRLHRDGRVSVRLKGNLWKGLFHLPRMQWYCWKLLEDRAGMQ